MARDSLGADGRLTPVTSGGAEAWAIKVLKPLHRCAAEDAGDRWLRFGFVFADAIPGKYDGLDDALSVVKMGGFYIICQLRLKIPHYAGRKCSHQPEVAVYKLSRSVENGTGW